LSSEETADHTLTLGQELMAAREQANLTLQAVEGILHISFSMLQDIENDKIDQGISPLFTKGYIKSYCGLLKLDQASMLDLYAAQYNGDCAVKQMQTFSNRSKLKEHNSYLNYVSWLIVLLLGATIFGWWYQQANTSTVLSDNIKETNAVIEQTELELVQGGDGAETSQPTLDLASIVFSEDCWIKVTDATNETIAIGIKKRGSTLTIRGVAPFEVNLGAANAVTITYQGNDLDISPYINGKTARFSVPLGK